MSLTFDNLTEDEQLKYTNELETWARSVRDAWRWRQQRIQEAVAANPPLTESTLNELIERLASGYAQRIAPQPTPDSIRAAGGNRE